MRRGDEIVTHHFGYVKVVTPAPNAPDAGVVSLGLETYGLRLEDGLGIGFFSDKKLYIPLDCRIVVLVANQAQLDRAIEHLNASAKEGVCVAQHRS